MGRRTKGGFLITKTFVSFYQEGFCALPPVVLQVFPSISAAGGSSGCIQTSWESGQPQGFIRERKTVLHSQRGWGTWWG